MGLSITDICHLSCYWGTDYQIKALQEKILGQVFSIIYDLISRGLSSRTEGGFFPKSDYSARCIIAKGGVVCWMK